MSLIDAFSYRLLRRCCGGREGGREGGIEKEGEGDWLELKIQKIKSKHDINVVFGRINGMKILHL